MAILKSLVAVAWTDGHFATEEREHLEALISAFGATDDEAAAVREYAVTPRTLADIPLSDLSADDRRTLLNHAVVLTHIDGEQTADEKELIAKLSGFLRIPDNESARIVEAAEARVKRLLASQA
ncbi:MAG: TerB family tellurite resistance protein [Myxococcales bacterium]|nr:TerB family tellurite resistance protein [Myxococcales bacterium]